MSQCIEWLNYHDKGIDGRVVELKKKIMDLKTNNLMPPKVNDAKLCSLNDINNCVGNLLSMISIVMIIEVLIEDTSDELNTEIRIFLTYIHTISASMDKYESTNNVKKKDANSTVQQIEKERNKKRTPYWI